MRLASSAASVVVSVLASPMEAFALGAFVLVVGAITLGVYLDSHRLGMGRPLLWTTLVLVGWSLTVVLYVLTDAPVAGLLVLGIGATALYLFERDDHLHGGEPADPHTLERTTDGESQFEGDADEEPNRVDSAEKN